LTLPQVKEDIINIGKHHPFSMSQQKPLVANPCRIDIRSVFLHLSQPAKGNTVMEDITN
jgi:hypothetical protein